MIAQLIPDDGSKPITIHRDVTLVGRKRDLCDVYIDHSSVSKLHCVLTRTDGLLFLRDLGSTNGTRVNGQRVTRGALLPGDELAVASVKFRIHLGPGDAAPPSGESSEQTEPLRLAEICASRSDDRQTISDDDVAPIHERFDSRTLESDSDVRLLPIESSDDL